MKEFINNFGDQFDDTDVTTFEPGTNFRELEEWSSLNALAIINMIKKKYGVLIKPEEMKQTTTIEQLFDLVSSKL